MTTPSLDEHAIALERARRHARRTVDAEEVPPRAPLHVWTIGELLDRPTPEYIIDNLLPVGALAELVGDSETMKSFFAIALTLSVASGQSDFFGLQVARSGPVLYVAAEGANSLHFRIRAWCTQHGVDVAQVPFYAVVDGVNLRDSDCQKELVEEVRRLSPVVIVFDTLHRCIPGAEENSSRDLGEVVFFAAKLQAVCESTVLFLHHPPKNDKGGRGRGSGALYYAADTEMSCAIDGKEEEDGTKVIDVVVKKQKDDTKVALKLRNVIVPVLDSLGRTLCHANGRTITSCVLEAVSDQDVAERELKKDESLRERIIKTVRFTPGCTTPEIRQAVKAGTSVVNACIAELKSSGHLEHRRTRTGRAWRTEYFVTSTEPGDEM